MCVGSVRDYVAVCTWTTVTTGWDKHADNMRMRKTCARTVYCLHPPSIAKRLNFRQAKEKSFIWNDLKNRCSLQDEDSHESQFRDDHKSLLGCHRGEMMMTLGAVCPVRYETDTTCQRNVPALVRAKHQINDFETVA